MSTFSHRVVLLTVGAAMVGFLSSSAMADGSGCRGDRTSMVRKALHGMQRHGGMTTPMLRHLLRHKQELGLTDEQVGKLRELALDTDRAAIRAHAEAMIADRELRALLWDEKADLGAIEAKVKAYEAMKASARIIGIRARRDLMGVLTPEQRAKDKTFWEEMRHRSRTSLQRAAVDYPMDGEGAGEDPAFEVEFSDASEGPSAG